MAGIRPQRWDIYWYNLVYEDNSDQIKKRPILILNSKEAIPIANKITSTSRQGDLEYKIIDWVKAGLDHPSIIRLGTNYPVDNNSLGSKIGRLTKKDIDATKKLILKYNLKYFI